MLELAAPDYSVARWVIERGLGALYFIAFVVAAQQFPALCGARGLEPATDWIRITTFRRAPSLFHWLRYTDGRLIAMSLFGATIAGTIVLGLPQQLPLPVTMLAWFSLWVLYQSIVNIGGSFYSFGWETLLLEAGFLAIFLGNAAIAPPLLVIFAFRWLAFRVEFGAGLIKLRGDPCWRDLTCMNFHHETQPMPNPLSWFFHHLPRPIHRVEAIGNFVAQLVLPFGLFLPQPVASIAGALMIVTQLYLVVSGNYAWLNWVTIIVMFSAIADPVVRTVLPFGTPVFEATPLWFNLAVIALAVLVIVLSYFPVRNLMSRYQAMNASFDPFRFVNTYGAFGSVSRHRDEVVVEGSLNPERGWDAEWREYEFKGKPGALRRVPGQWAPFHLRLDWLMWFLPLSPIYGERWFVPFLGKLLDNDRATLALLRSNPFPDAPPAAVRARLYRYRFTTWQELRLTGAWWHRELVGEYMPALRLGAR